MATTFKKQIESLSDAAKFFGLQGYFVDVTIMGETQTSWVTIYFVKLSEKEKINRALCSFKDDDDTIEFHSFDNQTNCDTFYTFSLRKECKL